LLFISGDGGLLRHTSANDDIFSLLGYQPQGDSMYHPPVGEKGEVLSKAVGPKTGKYLFNDKIPRRNISYQSK
jgi:hypothetical protein